MVQIRSAFNVLEILSAERSMHYSYKFNALCKTDCTMLLRKHNDVLGIHPMHILPS